MKIIYTYRKKSHAAYRAASLHLNIESKESIINAPKNGELDFIGIDENYHEVYICPRGKRLSTFNHLVKSMAEIYEEQVQVIDLSPYEAWYHHFVWVRKIKRLILQSREGIK